MRYNERAREERQSFISLLLNQPCICLRSCLCLMIAEGLFHLLLRGSNLKHPSTMQPAHSEQTDRVLSAQPSNSENKAYSYLDDHYFTTHELNAQSNSIIILRTNKKVRNRSDLEQHFVEKSNAKRFFKNI